MITRQNVFALARGGEATRRKVAENDDIATPVLQVLGPVRPDISCSADDEDAAGRGRGAGGGGIHGRSIVIAEDVSKGYARNMLGVRG